jgi:hypothetical protein
MNDAAVADERSRSRGKIAWGLIAAALSVAETDLNATPHSALSNTASSAACHCSTCSLSEPVPPNSSACRAAKVRRSPSQLSDPRKSSLRADSRKALARSSGNPRLVRSSPAWWIARSHSALLVTSGSPATLPVAINPLFYRGEARSPISLRSARHTGVWWNLSRPGQRRGPVPPAFSHHRIVGTPVILRKSGDLPYDVSIRICLLKAQPLLQSTRAVG